MTCPCKEMREAAAKVCSTESDLRELLEKNPIHGQDKMAQGHKAVTAGILAMLIRALPLCGKCETHVMVPSEADIDRALRVIIPGGSHAERLRAERDQWRIALMGLTAGGSEFTSPQACVEYVRATRTSQHETILKFKAESDLLRETLSKSADAHIDERDALQAELALLKEAVRDAPTIYADHRDINAWRENHAAAINIAGKP